MSNELQGKRIAFLATEGFEQVEFTQPWQAMKDAGAEVELVSLTTGQIDGFKHLDRADPFTVDKAVADVKAEDYQGLVLPGGVANPDALRLNADAVAFVKAFFEQQKPVAAICHALWMLVEADVVHGRTLTSFPSVATDIKNAGGHWVDKSVNVDDGLVTSRTPDDLGAFCAKTVEEFAEGRHAHQAA